MAKRAAIEKEMPTIDIRFGDLEIVDIYPKDLKIGGGEIEVVVFANGLFEKKPINNAIPKKDLMFRVMKEDKKSPDDVIFVGDIATDNIRCETDESGKLVCYVTVKITVPEDDTIIENSKRNIVLKGKFEPLKPDGTCVKVIKCSVPKNLQVTLIC